MARTRPTADQIRFHRSATGNAVNLDTYLEAAETEGGRQELAVILSKLIDPATGNPRSAATEVQGGEGLSAAAGRVSLHFDGLAAQALPATAILAAYSPLLDQHVKASALEVVQAADFVQLVQRVQAVGDSLLVLSAGGILERISLDAFSATIDFAGLPTQVVANDHLLLVSDLNGNQYKSTLDSAFNAGLRAVPEIAIGPEDTVAYLDDTGLGRRSTPAQVLTAGLTGVPAGTAAVTNQAELLCYDTTGVLVRCKIIDLYRAFFPNVGNLNPDHADRLIVSTDAGTIFHVTPPVLLERHFNDAALTTVVAGGELLLKDPGGPIRRASAATVFLAGMTARVIASAASILSIAAKDAIGAGEVTVSALRSALFLDDVGAVGPPVPFVVTRVLVQSTSVRNAVSVPELFDAGITDSIADADNITELLAFEGADIKRVTPQLQMQALAKATPLVGAPTAPEFLLYDSGTGAAHRMTLPTTRDALKPARNTTLMDLTHFEVQDATGTAIATPPVAAEAMFRLAPLIGTDSANVLLARTATGMVRQTAAQFLAANDTQASREALELDPTPWHSRYGGDGSQQSPPANTVVNPEFATHIDGDNSATAAPFEITIPVSGTYLLAIRVNWSAAPTLPQVGFIVNGAGIPAPRSTDATGAVTHTIELAAGDTLRGLVQHQGGVITFGGAATDHYFRVKRLL